MALFALALVASGCKRKQLVATSVAFEPGSTTSVVVHLKGDQGADISCTDGIHCEDISLNERTGEGDLTLNLNELSDDNKHTVTLRSQASSRTSTLTLDLDARLPLTVAVSSGMLSCVGIKCSGTLSVLTPAISLTVPAGTTVEVGSTHLKAGADGQIDSAISLTLATPLEKLVLASACRATSAEKAPAIATTTLSLTAPDGRSATSAIELSSDALSRELGTFLEPAKTTGVRFPWEKPGAGVVGKRAAVYLDGDCWAGGHAGATLGEVAVVAFGVPAPTRTEDCVYRLTTEDSTQDRGTAKATLTLHDEDVVAYERLTGKKLAQKMFHARSECVSDLKLAHPGDKLESQSSYVDSATVASWAATLK